MSNGIEFRDLLIIENDTPGESGYLLISTGVKNEKYPKSKAIAHFNPDDFYYRWQFFGFTDGYDDRIYNDGLPVTERQYLTMVRMCLTPKRGRSYEQ